MIIDQTSSVSLISLGREHEATFQNLIQFYTHEFSEFWAGTSQGDVQPNGRYADYALSDYWERPNWSASVIVFGSSLVGFCLVNNSSHINEVVNANVAEFFILRKFRGQGLGKSAARTMFSSRPGSWEVAVASRNNAAKKFWKRTIETSPEARHVQEIDVQTGRWAGTVFCFDWLAI